jgi:hypothetical protein
LVAFTVLVYLAVFVMLGIEFSYFQGASNVAVIVVFLITVLGSSWITISGINQNGNLLTASFVLLVASVWLFLGLSSSHYPEN